MLANFGEALCSLFLAILVTYSGNKIWRKKADLHHDGGSTQFACRIWPLCCKVDLWKCFKLYCYCYKWLRNFIGHSLYSHQNFGGYWLVWLAV